MKKAISMIVVCILLFINCSVSLAEEEFALRNGILFGDTLDIVKQKETLALNSSDDKINNVWFEGTIAGMSGSVRFDFNEETGGLTDMLYSFDTYSSKDSVDNDYSTLKKSLIRKYGNPIGNTGGSLHIIVGPAIEYGATIIALYKYIDGTGDFRDYDEWIVKANGYNVKIDLISCYTRDSDFEYTYYNVVSYHYYTDDDYLNAIQEKMDENAAIDNDL